VINIFVYRKIQKIKEWIAICKAADFQSNPIPVQFEETYARDMKEMIDFLTHLKKKIIEKNKNDHRQQSYTKTFL